MRPPGHHTGATIKAEMRALHEASHVCIYETWLITARAFVSEQITNTEMQGGWGW